jgi:hypothetical protein
MESDIGKPFIAVCSSHNEIIPGHVHLDEVAEIISTEIVAEVGECRGLCRRSEVQAAGKQRDRRSGTDRRDVVKGVVDSGMGTAADHDQPQLRIDNHSLVIIERIRYPPMGIEHQMVLAWEVMPPRYRPGRPDAWDDKGWP